MHEQLHLRVYLRGSGIIWLRCYADCATCKSSTYAFFDLKVHRRGAQSCLLTGGGSDFMSDATLVHDISLISPRGALEGETTGG